MLNILGIISAAIGIAKQVYDFVRRKKCEKDPAKCPKE